MATRPNVLAQLPNVTVSQQTLQRLDEYFTVYPSEMGERSHYAAFVQHLLGLAASSETKQKRRDRAKMLSDFHNGGPDFRHVVSVKQQFAPVERPDDHITPQLMRLTAKHRVVRACLGRMQCGAHQALRSIFEPQSYDTECGKHVFDNDVDTVFGPIDRTFGRFSFIALRTLSAGDWMIAEAKRTGFAVDSALPWVREICVKGNKAVQRQVWNEIEAIVQASFDAFEHEWREHFGRKVRHG